MHVTCAWLKWEGPIHALSNTSSVSGGSQFTEHYFMSTHPEKCIASPSTVSFQTLSHFLSSYIYITTHGGVRYPERVYLF